MGLVAASPIPYRVPLYQRIAQNPQINFRAIFASNGGIRPVDAGYAAPVSWDTDLLHGYRARFLKRANLNPIEGSPWSLRDADVIGVIRDERLDVLWLWGYNFLTHQLAALTQLSRRSPIIFSEEQTLLDHRPVWKSALKGIGLPLLFRRGRALYIGTQNYRWFRRYGVASERLHFTPYCVDNERLQRAARKLAPEGEQVRAQFGIRPGSGSVILFAARLIPKKEPLLLLEAFARARQERPCVLLIVGTGVMEAAMRREVTARQIPDVIFGGFLNQSEIGRAYACADLLVLPSSHRETWGLVVNEAMNFGLPVIVSDKVGCAIDLVKNAKNGYVVPANDVSALSSRIGALVDSAERRRAFGKASLDLIAGWNYDVAAAGVLDAVKASVGQARWDAACGAP